MVDIMRSTHRQRPSTLFLVGSYHIGKERAYLGAAAALGWKVWAPAAKRRVSADNLFINCFIQCLSQQGACIDCRLPVQAILQLQLGVLSFSEQLVGRPSPI